MAQAAQPPSRPQLRSSQRLQRTACGYLPAGLVGRAFISASLALRYSLNSKSKKTDMTAPLIYYPSGLSVVLAYCGQMSPNGQLGFVALALCFVQRAGTKRDRAGSACVYENTMDRNCHPGCGKTKAPGNAGASDTKLRDQYLATTGPPQR